ncbi:MAG: (Fe-S)-binding protein [Dehalococcoidales bacterium]|nr:MAG: (Fe-S)-binding protein [Dehalococcoidales bacterium]
MGLEQYQGDMDMCCRCSTCKFIPMQQVKGEQYVNVCPSIARYNFHAYSAGGRLNIGSSMLKNGFNYTDRLLDIVYNCQMCGACGVSCNYAMDMEVLEPIHEFRIKTIDDGHTNPALEKTVASLKKTGSMVPVKGKRGDWAKGLNVKDASKEKVEVLLHIGCLVSYDKEMQKLAKSTVKILQKAGVDFGIAGDAETCCGGRAYQMGYKDAFMEQAKKNAAMIKKSGANTVVTICADGYQAIKVLYERYQLREDVEVLHISEYVDKLIKDGKLKPRRKLYLAVTYHDPCRLGRLGEPYVHWEGNKIPGDRFVFDPPKPYRRGTNGVYEPPRDVIKAIPGIRFSEMTRIKEYSWCCGSGGGVSDSNPEFAVWTSKDRISEAISTGAETIVTACPWCEKTLNEAVKESGSNMKVYDIVELLEKAI